MQYGVLVSAAHLATPAAEKPDDGRRSPRWPAVERAHVRQHPACAACGGTDHLQVHHVEPFHVCPEKELDPANLITLCMAPGERCHYLIGHLGTSWHAWNVHVRRD